MWVVYGWIYGIYGRTARDTRHHVNEIDDQKLKAYLYAQNTLYNEKSFIVEWFGLI